MTVRKARAIEKLFDEFNYLFPGRSRLSDGWLGDAAHKSRDSDHNAWIVDGPDRVVSAGDITEDGVGPIKEIIDWAFAIIIKNRDPRVKYLIHEDRICRSYDKPGIPAWTWSNYDGPNAHVKHGHISVNSEKKHYDSTKPWGLVAAVNDAPKPKNRVELAHALAGQSLAKLHAAIALLRQVDKKRTAVHTMEDEWNEAWHQISNAKKAGPSK